MGRKAGLSDDELRAVLSENRTSFNDTERLVIELADAMTDTPAKVQMRLPGLVWGGPRMSPTIYMRVCENNFPKNN